MSPDQPDQAAGSPSRLLRFADFAFDTDSGELRRDGETVSLAPQPAVVLEVLLRRAGDVVPREELYAELWGDGVHVDYQQGLNYCIRQVRIALDDDAEAPRFIETLPRRGYRFLVEPTVAEAEVPAAARLPVASPSEWPGGGKVAAVVLLGALTGLSAVAALQGAAVSDSPETEATAATASAAAVPAGPARQPYLTARYLMGKEIPEPRRAIEEYRRALRADPDLGAAWAGLADAYRTLTAWRGLEPEPGYSLTLDAADRALELGHDTAAVHVTRGIALLYRDLDWRAAGAAFDDARRVEPDSPPAWFWHARALSAAGDHDGAVRAAERSLLLDPESRQVVVDLGWFHLLAGRYEDAVGQCEHALDLEPSSPAALRCLISAHGRLGDQVAAARASRRLVELISASGEATGQATRFLDDGDLGKFWSWTLHYLAEACPVNSYATFRAAIYTLVGDRQAAIDQLEVALEERHGWAPFIAVDPTFAELREDPRFRSLVGRTGRPSPSSPTAGG